MATQTFTLTIDPVNDAPMVTSALFGPTHPSDSGPCQIDPQLCQVLQSTAMDTLDHAPTDQSNFFDSITVEMVWEKVNLLLA